MKVIITLLFAVFSLTVFTQTKSINSSAPLSEASANSVGMSAE